MNFKESMLLLIPNQVESSEEWESIAEKATQANDAVIDFWDGRITLDSLFQQLEHNNCDVDGYIADLAETVRIFGA